jgi:polysaccharide deacetylase family protein (PEP-CTERM system associated)
MRNAFTVDVEDYFQVSAFDGSIERGDWTSLPSRVERNTERLLALLERHGVSATFFVLAWIAERHPGLIRTIVGSGHELASHGCDHRRLVGMDAHAVAEDLRRSKQILEDVGGVAVRGYRAPTFSIGKSNLWVHGLLRKAGFAYSSSIYPVRHDLYGYPESPRTPYLVEPDGILEIPITTKRAFGRNWPAGGGGYFRLLPYAVSRWLIRSLNEDERMPCVFYTHPWEIDAEQPVQHGVSLKTRFRHYTNLERMESKLERLLTDLEWGRMDGVFPASATATGPAPTYTTRNALS